MNRPDFVLRQLEFYKKTNCQHTIYIGDSSSEINRAKLVNNLDQYSESLNIKYFHWPNKNDREAVADLGKEVEEDYCALVGDDDFLIPSSITRCAEFLDSNLDYATAQGKALLFSTKNDDLYAKIKDLSIYWDIKQLHDDSVARRVQNFSKKYWVNLFSIHRTKDFIVCSEKTRDLSERGLAEFLYCFYFIALGKSKYIDCLYLIRQMHSERGLSPLSPTFYGEERLHSNEWRDSAEIFIETISSYISDTDKISSIKARKISKLCLQNVSQKKIDKSWVFRMFIKIKSLIKRSDFLNTNIRLLIKSHDDLLKTFIDNPNVKDNFIFFEQFIQSKGKI